MRLVFAVALLSVASLARAADLPVAYRSDDYATRSEMIWLYDVEPGVVVRAYWSEPWHGHHFFPYAGIAPRVGRYERLSGPAKPAKSYTRTWNNNWAFEHSPVILPSYNVQGESYQQNAYNQGDNQGNNQDNDRGNHQDNKHNHHQTHTHHHMPMPMHHHHAN